jgi:hypothetical protein
VGEAATETPTQFTNHLGLLYQEDFMTEQTQITEDDFRRALLGIRPIAPHHIRLLRAHYYALNHTVTATELARAVGYADYRAVNLHYGKFVVRISEFLHRPYSFDSILAGALPSEAPPRHLQLVMKPELVQALDTLCWSWSDLSDTL